MPRILKSILALARAKPSQPGLTPDAQTSDPFGAAPSVQPEALRARDEQASGVHPIAAPAPAERADPAKCKHLFATFSLPAEGKGRVYQCQLCRAIGFKLNRFGGQGAALSKSIRLYTCSKPKCQGVAIKRMIGRGPRGAYIWACEEHGGLMIEGRESP
jgi:hypothetical protein